jgi:hypothetical protein
MKGNRTSPDLLTRHASLHKRIRNLLDGVTPMHFYIGAFGLNTSWFNLSPRAGWHYVGGAHIQCRLRSDVVYLRTNGEKGGIAPVSIKGWPSGPAFIIPGKPHVFWPSYRVNVYCVTTLGTVSVMTVKPNGHVYFTKPSKGRTLRPGSCSWPRG